MTSYNNTSQEAGNAALSSSENKRNKKTQMLTASLSATALGVFLEGCGGGDGNGGSGDRNGGDRNGGGGSGNRNFLATSAEDAHSGGTGIDSVSYANSPVGVTVNLLANTGSGGNAEGDTFDSIENLIGSKHDDRLTGDENPNTLEGGAGGDSLNGGEGIDTVSYENAGARIAVDLLTNTLEAGDAVGDTFDSIENVIGSGYSDSISGDNNPNTLDGGVGDDTIYGYGGKDTLNGGAGDDTIEGGDGDDILNGGAGNDKLYGYGGQDRLNGGAGDDKLFGITGNNGFSGGGGNDILNGGTGAFETYYFERGDGIDSIINVSRTATYLYFGTNGSTTYEGGDFAASAFDRDGDNLVITLASDTITIENAYDSDNNTGTGNTAFTIDIHYYSDSVINLVTDVWSTLTD